MKNFHHIVMPGKLPCGSNNTLPPAHFSVTFKDGKLSICGVIGAKSNGDCVGSSGQCTRELKNPKLVLAPAWTADDVQKFISIWERWHLNDLRPECEHQRADGWREKAKEKVTLYHWVLTDGACKEKKAAETAAINALEDGRTFIPTKKQTAIALLDYYLTTHTEILSEPFAKYYEPKKTVSAGGKNHTEVKTLGWLYPEEHPDGLLTKPCPICGYEYGTAWLSEEVPQDVSEWLAGLPKASQPCAWKGF